jgi:dephospho-CoA kinase
MLQIGLTGGIGAGKSTVSSILSELGCLVYNSDQRAKWLMKNNHDLKKSIVNWLGEKSYLDNDLNRSFISNVVFEDNLMLNKLNSLVHPYVAKDYQSFISSNQNTDIVVKEAAILIESGAYKKMDLIILVVSNEQNRIQRVIKRDNSDFKKVHQRINQQMKDEDKSRYADFVLENNGTNSELASNVKAVIEKIRLKK